MPCCVLLLGLCPHCNLASRMMCVPIKIPAFLVLVFLSFSLIAAAALVCLSVCLQVKCLLCRAGVVVGVGGIYSAASC